MSYIIGSFNLRKMAMPDSNKLNTISEIIRNENMDVVALQEVFREEAVRSLLTAIGALQWDYAWDRPKNNDSHNANEGYAFIWKKRRLSRVSTNNSNGKTRDFAPRIVEQYRRFGYSELMRPPFYGRFTPSESAGGNQMELRLLNVHIRFSGDENEFSNIQARRNEFQILTEGLLPKIQDKVYGTNYNTYTLILGDYNLNIHNLNNQSPFLNEQVELRRNGKSHYIMTVLDNKTTLKADQTIPYLTSEDRLANNYDHFTYDNIINSKCDILQCRRVDAQKYTNDDFEQYKKEVSDHLPILIELDIRGGTNVY